MKKSFILLFLAISITGHTHQWPVKNPAVISAFGENRADYYSSGIDIITTDDNVYASESGEIVYYHDEGNSVSGLPSGLGSFLILEHERQIRTSYAHLKSISVLTEKNIVSAGEKIGIIGDTGASISSHLNFKVFDKEINEAVNPLLILPLLADETKPLIKGIFIFNRNNSEIIELQSGISIKSGIYSIITEIYDLCEGVDYFCPVAPYWISLSVENEEVEMIAYNSLKTEDNKTIMSGNNKSVLEYYYSSTSPWLVNAGEIKLEPEGLIDIELRAKDFAGNEAVKKITVRIVE